MLTGNYKFLILLEGQAGVFILEKMDLFLVISRLEVEKVFQKHAICKYWSDRYSK